MVNDKKKPGLADKLLFKKSKIKHKKQLNPFEVHINKEKFKILGKKTKNDRGLPGVSRAKAIKKRKNTIGFEMKFANKQNTFLDKRIGEKDVALTEEEKAMARFAAEKIHQHKAKLTKQSIYNLGEDEILTHRGQTLEEIEKFDDPRSDDEDDEGLVDKKFGHLREKFVSEVNFGGGVLSRGENEDGAKSRKDLIEQLIIESKKRKLEKQKLKEETLDMTEKLDSEWKDLHVVVSKAFNEPQSTGTISEITEKKNEDYDKTMRELKFEPRGTPSDRLKSEEEIAKTEKTQLDKLEEDRIARMHGIVNESSKKNKHRSADDLDDGYVVDNDPELVIAYDSEGQLLMPIKSNLKKDKTSIAETKNTDSNEDTEVDEDENSDEDDDESGNDSDDSLNDLRDLNESSDEEETPEKTEDIDESKSKESNDESFEGTKPKKRVSFAIDNEVENVSTKTPNKTITSCLVKRPSDVQKPEIPKKCEDEIKTEDIKENLLARKLMMEKAAEELPYVFDMPKSYDVLADLLSNQPPDYQHIIVERIIKCNHPSLNEGNKKKLGNLFAYLIQFLNDLFSEENLKCEKDIQNAFKSFDRLVLHFYNLAQMDPTNAKDCVLAVVKEKYDDYKNHERKVPAMDTIIFFKLVSILFSTSDLRHPVVTPCFYFMSQILTMARFKNSIDVSRGIFVTILVLEYTALSKRFLPSAINFIAGLLFLCMPLSRRNEIRHRPLFRFNAQNKELLSFKDGNTDTVLDQSNTLPARYLIQIENNNEFKVKIFISAIKVFDAFFKQTVHYPNQSILFESHLAILKAFPISRYPSHAVDLFKSIITYLDETLYKKALKPLVEENKRIKSIHLYEPAFDNDFSGKKRKVMSKEKIEHEKLVYKHKKEMKGALREIRRDKSYINSVKIKDKIRSDNVRKEKVKQIYSEASMQQGELNALQRSKKHKK